MKEKIIQDKTKEAKDSVEIIEINMQNKLNSLAQDNVLKMNELDKNLKVVIILNIYLTFLIAILIAYKYIHSKGK